MSSVDGAGACGCQEDSRCGLGAAVACGWHERAAGKPMLLRFEAGLHAIETIVLDARLRVSTLELSGEVPLSIHT